MKKTTAILAGLALSCFALTALDPQGVIGQEKKNEAPLPTSAPVVDVSNPEQALYRIAVPDLQGVAGLGPQGSAVLRNDFALISLFKVLDPASFVADLKKEGLSITPTSWQSVGAQGRLGVIWHWEVTGPPWPFAGISSDASTSGGDHMVRTRARAGTAP